MFTGMTISPVIVNLRYLWHIDKEIIPVIMSKMKKEVIVNTNCYMANSARDVSHLWIHGIQSYFRIGDEHSFHI